MPNKPSNNPLSEGLQFRDLEGMMKPTVHVDEFSSKMGDDADIIVLSFYVRDRQAAKDLVSWFEKGYDFVLDADRSPGEIKPNRFLVYVEMRRRRAASKNVEELLDDLGTLTEFGLADWTIKYKDQQQEFSEDSFRKLIPLTPEDYTRENETDLNEWREAAGLPVKRIHRPDRDLIELQHASGI
jgi:hypothetical protein